MLIDFPLDEAAAAGGRLEVEGGALIVGAALPELAHGIQAGPGVPVSVPWPRASSARSTSAKSGSLASWRSSASAAETSAPGTSAAETGAPDTSAPDAVSGGSAP